MELKDNLGIVPQITAGEKKMYEDTEVTADDIKAWQKELDLKGSKKREYAVFAYCPTIASAKKFKKEWDKALVNASKVYENS